MINNFVSPLQGDDTGSVSFQALRRRPVQDIGGLRLGGHHVIRRSVLAWDLNSSVARTRDQGYSTAHFSPLSDTNPLNNVQYALDVSNPLEPHLSSAERRQRLDPTKYFYTGQSVQYMYSPEVALDSGLVATPYSLVRDVQAHSSLADASAMNTSSSIKIRRISRPTPVAKTLPWP